MSITDNTIYVIGIDQNFLLEDVYDSMEEAIEDIESPDKCHMAFKYTRKDHVARVYKTSPRELSRFYKEFTLHSIPDPNKYFKAHLTQVYPDPFKGYTINELVDEGLKLCSDEHCDSDSISRILKQISELSKSTEIKRGISSDSTVYVIGINHKVLLDGICESIEEAVTDINYYDKHGIKDGHKMQVYKATIRELIEFYKGYRSAADIEKYIDSHLTQVYPKE